MAFHWWGLAWGWRRDCGLPLEWPGREAVFRRLGFLMELWNMDCPGGLKELQGHLTTTYVRLDPGLPAAGRFLRRWRVQLNVSPEEIRAAVRT